MTILTFLLTSSCRALSLASDFLMRFISTSIWRLSSKICWKCPFTQSTLISLKIQIQTTWLTLSFSVASSSIISGIPHVIAAHLSSVRATVPSASFNSTHRSSSSLFSCLSSSLTGKHRCFEVLYMQGPWNDWTDVIIEQMTVMPIGTYSPFIGQLILQRRQWILQWRSFITGVLLQFLYLSLKQQVITLSHWVNFISLNKEGGKCLSLCHVIPNH